MAPIDRSVEKAKKDLMGRKVQLEQELTQLSSDAVVENHVQDPGDQALSLSMEMLQVSFQDAELHEYKRIMRALEKIEDGSYGVCIDCGDAISEKRLKSYPDAARCIACQEVYEEKGSLG